MLISEKISPFASDTLRGLSSEKKFLLPKYFYDKQGSKIFQKIMRMPEYYLTDSEYEIFREQSEEICSAITPAGAPFDLIELGSGDGLKSKILLKRLTKQQARFRYIPVDISLHSLHELKDDLQKELPDLEMKELQGDFFPIMKNYNGSHHQRVILFLGSNIGNFLAPELDYFLNLLSRMSRAEDKTIIGFDLKKSPHIIINAYDDPHGHTRAFNLNHLSRINHELGADFVIDDFQHHTSYDPDSGAMKSFLISSKDQQVHIQKLKVTIHFKQWESVFMELSQKFDVHDIDKLAQKYGFRVEKNFMDQNKYFTDSLWVRQKD